ncbi:sodium-dependent transporter [Halioxenophilus sp. WMMB6]|uniref:sodium-dependent transporter n=1 Tax=Halioxenophilus sp. WMMB6 TaxID=3073815 RepID=UPI00295E9E00|nr:sodium-dependent transporter [Halioxenophilus sp. WMMB6]
MASRELFSSKMGFVMAAAGSAVGLGNIWGFPTNTASNGGAAFVLVYLVLAFCLAYPALMAELVIGRASRANIVTSLRDIAGERGIPWAGILIGGYGVIIASLIYSFYSIVAGWMVAHWAESLTTMAGQSQWSEWLVAFGLKRNIIFTAIFMGLTMAIISRGVSAGIERWSTRLMPVMMLLLVVLIIYVLTQNGASEGLKLYLIPHFSDLKPQVFLSAMGQAFFSLSLGVGTMLIYGSYLSDKENLPQIGAIVTLTDTGIAFIAGLLILPAIYVAKEYGTNVFTDGGELIAGPDLIFQVLPALFGSMGTAGTLVAFAFFTLMTIAALTSSISMLEVPVSLATENTKIGRGMATLIIGSLIFLISVGICLNFGALFGWVINFTTVYSEPVLGILLCVFVGWLWHRNKVLNALKPGMDNAEQSLFFKIWPMYVRFVCPLLILATFIQSLR